MKARAYQIQRTARGIEGREREEERAEEENKTLELLATTEEEKLPRFHIFAQVDYSGLFSSFAACLLAAL